MATGKTNSRWIRFICDEFDLSGDSRSIGSMGASYMEDDATGFSDGVHNFTLGTPTAVLDSYQAVFAADIAGDANRSFDVLKAPEDRIISVPWGIKAAPTEGDIAYLHYASQASFTHDGAGPILITANLPRGTDNLTLAQPWGYVLAAGSSISATTNYTAVDNGAGTTNGLIAFLHVTATASGSWTLKVQHASSPPTYADLITFSSDGSAITSEVGTSTGTVNQYIRFQATRSTGTTTFWCVAARQ